MGKVNEFILAGYAFSSSITTLNPTTKDLIANADADYPPYLQQAITGRSK